MNFKLNTGNQIPCDSIVVSGYVECDESLLTGESDVIRKIQGDELLSGSFITAGSCIAKVVNVGEDNYINKLAKEAKVLKKYPSKLRDSLKLYLENGLIYNGSNSYWIIY